MGRVKVVSFDVEGTLVTPDFMLRETESVLKRQTIIVNIFLPISKRGLDSNLRMLGAQNSTALIAKRTYLPAVACGLPGI